MNARLPTSRRLRGPLRAATAAGLVLSLVTHQDPALHAVAGTAFLVAMSGHLVLNRRWIRTVLRRVRSGLTGRMAVDAGIVVALVTLAATVAGTGLAALLDVTGAARLPVAGHLHAPAAILLTLVTLVHVARHRRQMRRRPAGQRREPARSRDAAPAPRSPAAVTGPR